MIVFARIFLCVLVLTRASSDQSRGEAEKKCKEYVKYACDNQISPYPTSTPSPTLQRIMNGKIMSSGMLPHMAYISIKRNISGIEVEKSCTGALISEYYVMTAVHCGEEAIPFAHSFGKVKLGSVTKSNDGTGEWFDIVQMVTHPNHSSSSIQWRNDILLLKLDREVAFSPFIRPICLSTKLGNDLSNVTASGWGMDKSSILSEVFMSIEFYIDDEKVKSACSKALKTGIFANETVICAGHSSEMKSEAVINGGAPLQIPSNSGCPYTYEQIGISLGKAELSNADLKYVDIFTNVEMFIPWIEVVVWPIPVKDAV